MDESRFVPAPASSEPPDVSDLRCRDCQQLRRSLPRHTSGCRYAGQNCPGCVYSGADHIAACPIAGQLKLPTDTCCEGVDIPSQGNLHSPDCRNLRPVLRASHTLEPELPAVLKCWIIQRCTQRWCGTELIYEDFPTPEGRMGRAMAGTVLKRVASQNPDEEFRAHRISEHCYGVTCGGHGLPSAADLDHAAEELAIAEATKAYAAEAGRERHDVLLGQLVFAARDLAQSRIAGMPTSQESAASDPCYCLDCRQYVGVTPHAPHCRAGRVLSVLADLIANVEANRKTVVCGVGDDAPLEMVTGRPGSILRYCQKCGAEDRAWHAEQRPGVEVQLDCLGLNQCVGAGKNGQGHTLYTHCCGQKGAAR